MHAPIRLANICSELLDANSPRLVTRAAAAAQPRG